MSTFSPSPTYGGYRRAVSPAHFTGLSFQPRKTTPVLSSAGRGSPILIYSESKTTNSQREFQREYLVPQAASVSPEPPSLPSPFNNLEDIIRQLLPVLQGDAAEVQIPNIQSETYDALCAKADASELPGWEHASIDWRADRLIVRRPTLGHEAISTLLTTYPINLADPIENAHLHGGSANVDLDDGAKSPDWSFYDPAPKNIDKPRKSKSGRPTVIFEVGFSEVPRQVAEDCARQLLMSHGEIRLAIGIDIDSEIDSSGARKLNSIHVTQWQVVTRVAGKTRAQLKNNLPASRANVIFKRNDKGPGTTFEYLRMKGQGVDGQCVYYEAYGLPVEIYPGPIPEEHGHDICIYNWQLYRTKYRGQPEELAKVAIRIPYQQIIDTVIVRNAQQTVADIRRKQPQTEEKEADEEDDFADRPNVNKRERSAEAEGTEGSVVENRSQKRRKRAAAAAALAGQ